MNHFPSSRLFTLGPKRFSLFVVGNGGVDGGRRVNVNKTRDREREIGPRMHWDGMGLHGYTYTQHVPILIPRIQHISIGASDERPSNRPTDTSSTDNPPHVNGSLSFRVVHSICLMKGLQLLLSQRNNNNNNNTSVHNVCALECTACGQRRRRKRCRGIEIVCKRS